MKLKLVPSLPSSGWPGIPEEALTPGGSKMASLDRVKVLVLGDSGERFHPPLGLPTLSSCLIMTFFLHNSPPRSSNDLAPAKAESPLKV